MQSHHSLSLCSSLLGLNEDKNVASWCVNWQMNIHCGEHGKNQEKILSTVFVSTCIFEAFITIAQTFIAVLINFWVFLFSSKFQRINIELALISNISSSFEPPEPRYIDDARRCRRRLRINLFCYKQMFIVCAK